MTLSLSPKDQDNREQVEKPKTKPETALSPTLSLAKPSPEQLTVAMVFPGESDFPPEFHPLDWFINLNHTDEVEKLFGVLAAMVDEADLAPLRMREGVNETTTPSALEHLRRLDKNIDHLTEDYQGNILKIWIGEKAAAWYSMSEQLCRTIWYLRERLKWTKKVLFDSEYSRFRLRWHVEYTRIIASEYAEKGKDIKDKAVALELSREIRTRMIDERGQFRRSEI